MMPGAAEAVPPRPIPSVRRRVFRFLIHARFPLRREVRTVFEGATAARRAPPVSQIHRPTAFRV
ncbi:hypothetical protein DXM22_08995 [Agrobacterium vitis]|nr:hypothetical protein DXM22_08995 [Agrobacterium vitis]RCU53393.1 hypothetical protein ASB66_017320 [Agrobacterium vitis]